MPGFEEVVAKEVVAAGCDKGEVQQLLVCCKHRGGCVVLVRALFGAHEFAQCAWCCNWSGERRRKSTPRKAAALLGRALLGLVCPPQSQSTDSEGRSSQAEKERGQRPELLSLLEN